MDRRKFLKTTSLAAAATAAGSAAPPAAANVPVAAPAVVAGIRELRMALPWADSVSGPADSAQRLASRIEEATDRRYRIHIAAETDKAGADFASVGADLYYSSEHDRAHLDSAFAYFAGLPFSAGLTPDGLEGWLTLGGGQELWDELAGEHGVKPLLAGHLGRAPRLWSNRPIASVRDIHGARVAAYGPTSDVLHALGAETVSVPVHQLGSALRAGELDAVEFGGGTLQAMASAITPAARLSYEIDPAGAGTAITLGISRSLWDRMSQSDRTIFAACASEAYRLSIAEADSHEQIILSALCNLHGVSAAPLAAEVRSALPPIAEAVVAMLAAASPHARRINASYMAFRRAAGRLSSCAVEIPLA